MSLWLVLQHKRTDAQFSPCRGQKLFHKRDIQTRDNGGFLRTGVQMNRSSPKRVEATAAKLALEQTSWLLRTPELHDPACSEDIPQEMPPPSRWTIKHRKNCETALTPGIPRIPGIPVFVIVFVIVIVLVFVVVFLLVRSCFLIALIKCLKGQKYQRLLFEGVL